LAAAKGSSMAGLGNGIRGVAGGRAPMERTVVQKRRPKIRTRANPLPITGLRTVTLLEPTLKSIRPHSKFGCKRRVGGEMNIEISLKLKQALRHLIGA
jgi:hypothetical protein